MGNNLSLPIAALFKRLSNEDLGIAMSILGGPRDPDITLAPDGNPYLYRWHVIPRNRAANVYFHIQVASDPERPLHDHPWDNQSVILSGGYTELLSSMPTRYGSVPTSELRRSKGDVVCRRARWAHRLLMPEGVPYTMTLFSTGPHRRPWGFWYPDGWVDAKKVCRLDGNTSVHVGRDG